MTVIFHELELPLCYFNFFQIWWGHSWIIYLQKGFGFSPFFFYYLFMKLFLLHSKTKNAVKDIKQNFTPNNLNKKKSVYPSVKKVICEHLTLNWYLLKFWWKVVARESKKCLPGSNCVWWTVLPESANYFSIKPSDTPMINPVLQNKNLVTWKKNDSPCFLGEPKEVIWTTPAN